eukprot:3618_1
MSQSPQHRNLVMDTYNKIVQNGIDNPLELLQSTIDYLTFEKSNVSEISLLYCLQSDYYFEKDLYDKAYKSAMAAAQVDSDREQVLWALIRIHTQQTNGNEGARSNPHEDDEKALQYCTKLENLYPDNRYSLYVASHCYSALGLYDKAIRILKRVFSKISEKPIIETSQQIKISEPVADRNQTNEVDTDEKEEEECKEHATTNDSENENKTDETLSQRKASPTLDVKAIDIHTKTPHPPSKVSQTMTHRDVSSEKSMVDTPDMDGKDGEESTEQSITNSDSEGETKTQETQDDEDNKRNKQSIKVSIGRDNEGKVRPPIDGNNNAIEWQTGPNGGRYYVTESGDKYYNSTDATLIYGEDEYGRILYRGVKGGYYFLSGTGQSKQYVTLPKDIVEAYRKRHLKFINVQSDSE